MAKKIVGDRFGGRDRPVLLTLVCGHQVKLKYRPMNAKAGYVCEAAQGCGYSVGWKSYSEGSFTEHNKLYSDPDLNKESST